METIEMKHEIPAWAKQRVRPDAPNCTEVRRLYGLGRVQLQLHNLNALRDWAKSRGWPTPWLGFKKAFVEKLFENDETFSLALKESGIAIHIPIKEHTLSRNAIKELDAMYELREDMGVLGQRPTQWGMLVSRLRQIRRLVEAGIEINVGGTQTVLNTWQGFYDWAHGRYRMLEDGYDEWIGDDG